ncbi:hypothetical protein ACFWZW_00465 [Microbacterium enclense]|uniref:hypothetical protein n=1 Tax=Microbacterium enclense TaxID=993073 RepID=UPI0036DB7C6C
MSKRLLAWAAGLELAQGIVMEGAPLLGLLVILATGGDLTVMSRGFSFVVPYFDETLR